jgi:oxygen-independent coproporphyrinogen-3 oxidase
MNLVPDYFDNISVDLILGLPGTNRRMWEDTLRSVVSWPIRHISIYLLMMYNKTPLFFKCRNSKITLLDDTDLIDMYVKTVSFLQDYGFVQYEISNFAKKGFESIHNQAYWDRFPYKGFGLGASSFDGASRFVNEKNLFYYIKRCNGSNGFPGGTKEVLSNEQVFLEVLMLGLRQKKGVDLQDVLYFLKDDAKSKFLNGIEDLENESLIQNQGGRIYLTLKGMLLENEVILSLI